MELFAILAEHAAAPDRRVGPPAVRRCRCVRRKTSRGPRESVEPDQARPGENVALFAPLLDIPLPAERALLCRRMNCGAGNWRPSPVGDDGARTQPGVLALEDLHWADPTTLDLLRGIAERGALAPLFVLMTARPEFRPPWGARSHHGAISLVPLDRHQVRQMVEQLAARHALPKDVIDGVTERTGGVPLFIEEVTRLLLERGEQGGIQAIPPTLQQSLTARLDRLGPAREVAQVGAVIGRGFSYTLFRAVAGMEDTACRRRWNDSPRRTSCWSRACRRNPIIASSTR